MHVNPGCPGKSHLPSPTLDNKRWRNDSALQLGRTQSTFTLDRVASSGFVIGTRERNKRQMSNRDHPTQQQRISTLSKAATEGRNSMFHNLSAEDRDILGGIEHRALKLVLKATVGACRGSKCKQDPALPYFFGMHLLGAICLVPWIQNAPSRYTDYL